MKFISIVVLFKLILSSNLCCAYMPVYHVANQDLLKGILLGALLTSPKHPPHLLNVMPMPYYNNYGNPSPQPYAYQTPAPNVEQNHAMHDMYHRDRPTEQPNASLQQMRSQHYETESQQPTQPQSQQQQHHLQQQEQQQHHIQHQEQQPRPQQQQRSESLFEPVVADPPTEQSNQTPQRSEPVIPSMETIQRNLGFPGHSVILMILPFNEKEQNHSPKKPNRTEPTTDSMNQPEPHIEQEPHPSEEDMTTNYDNSLKTNAIKIGSKHLNSKGWKPGMKMNSKIVFNADLNPVPKTTTATTTTTEPSLEINDRYNRFNMNKFIERSQFGLRNRDLNQYYTMDQMHD